MTDKELVQQFIQQVISPMKHNDSFDVREFNFFNALADTLGHGTAYFTELLFANELRSNLICDKFLAHDSCNTELLTDIAKAWFGQPQYSEPSTENSPLSEQDLQQWQTDGYVIVRNIISRAEAEKVTEKLFQFENIDKDKPTTWYNRGASSIMLEYYQNPMLDLVRHSAKARRAFEQLWQRDNLICSVDRVSFNAPETNNYKFPGPHLHLDVNFFHPLHFKTQGIVYLNDVAEDQGALTLCKGFHHHFAQWIKSFDRKDNPNQWDFNQLDSSPIAANAGDLIIWHHWLPHGSSPNRNTQPRVAQYLNMYSLEPLFTEN